MQFGHTEMTEINHKYRPLRLLTILFFPLVFSLLIFLVFILEKGMDWDFVNAGISPRDIKSIYTIFSFVFIHKDWSHLINNLISLTVLNAFLFYFYRPASLRIFIVLWFMSGTILWVIGRESIHIGASGLVYSLASFLFFSGLIRKHIQLIAISFIVALEYGNIIWHIFPWKPDDSISWEGHLAGFISGLIIAIAERNNGPQRPEKTWEDETDPEHENPDTEDTESSNNVETTSPDERSNDMVRFFYPY